MALAIFCGFFKFVRELSVFASNRDIELRLRKNNLFAQYQELICLRAAIARLLNPLKVSRTSVGMLG
jgi:hypothetical protein